MYAGLLPETNAFSTAFQEKETLSPSLLDITVDDVQRLSNGFPRNMKEDGIKKEASEFRRITAVIG